MNLYSAIRPAMFALDAETSHRLVLRGLGGLYRLPGGRLLARTFLPAPISAPVEVMGIRFRNRVGLAAGLDKNASCVPAWFDMGFGFVELGTVTPRPQPGNPRPRLFRLTRHEALINRMGFNNCGLVQFLANLRVQEKPGIIGINLGKNRDTPVERALDDYLTGLRGVYALADYITINISSPNTPGLRLLQEDAQFARLLDALKREQTRLHDLHARYVPLVVKIAPDLDETGLREIAGRLRDGGADGVIATNTTIERPGLEDEPLALEEGGLSGRPLHRRSVAVVEQLARELSGRLPIIGVGGILDADDAEEMIRAGASLVQIYTGLIYRGPELVRAAAERLAERPAGSRNEIKNAS